MMNGRMICFCNEPKGPASEEYGLWVFQDPWRKQKWWCVVQFETLFCEISFYRISVESHLISGWPLVTSNDLVMTRSWPPRLMVSSDQRMGSAWSMVEWLVGEVDIIITLNPHHKPCIVDTLCQLVSVCLHVVYLLSRENHEKISIAFSSSFSHFFSFLVLFLKFFWLQLRPGSR